MILADTSIWVDHLRANDCGLAGLLSAEQVVMHPFVIGEIALGHLPQRQAILSDLQSLPELMLATDEEALLLIDSHRLFGRGIGYVDAHLLASVRLTPETRLWTRDGRLHAVAAELGLAAPEIRH